MGQEIFLNSEGSFRYWEDGGHIGFQAPSKKFCRMRLGKFIFFGSSIRVLAKYFPAHRTDREW